MYWRLSWQNSFGQFLQNSALIGFSMISRNAVMREVVMFPADCSRRTGIFPWYQRSTNSPELACVSWKVGKRTLVCCSENILLMHHWPCGKRCSYISYYLALHMAFKNFSQTTMSPWTRRSSRFVIFSKPRYPETTMTERWLCFWWYGHVCLSRCEAKIKELTDKNSVHRCKLVNNHNFVQWHQLSMRRY